MMWGMRGWGKRDLLLGGAHSELWRWVGRFWSEARRWVYSGNWKCNVRYMVWEVVHPGDCGRVTPGSGSWKWRHFGDWMFEPRCRVWEVGSL